ncbi:MAG: Hsp20/alpha crystallin family protein [Akkermansiaceae bacterium]
MNSQVNTLKPRYKTRAHEAGFELAISLPGVTRDRVNVTLEKDLLTITGERSNLEGEFDRREQEATRFELKVTLHEDLDPTKAQATHRDGVLILTLQKRKEVAPRKIDILAN